MRFLTYFSSLQFAWDISLMSPAPPKTPKDLFFFFRFFFYTKVSRYGKN
uniref:Uncharacterized protein n=1 Tax=Rhizophora mucronata TaxID=61149 RepID=A0A2P2Q8F2_RHIMU